MPAPAEITTPPALAPTLPSQPWYADTLQWWRWLRARPAAAGLVLTLLGTIGFFLGGIKLFTARTDSTFSWAWESWDDQGDYEHAKLIPLIFLFLVWNAQAKLRRAKVASSAWGWVVLVFGILCFLASARTIQPRLALGALPIFLFGTVLCVWGKEVGRALLFPCGFLFFMVPLPMVEQATVGLQLLATRVAAALCGVFGIHLQAVGTTIRAADASFQFEIAGGCSGIRSLMAITMLTAIFVHLTQDRLWKKVLLFALSMVFAIIGNVARITAIMIVAKFFGQKLAGGAFHDLSTWIISFPFAFVAMYGAGKLVNWCPTPEQRARWLQPASTTAPTGGPVAVPTLEGGRRTVAQPATTYDY